MELPLAKLTLLSSPASIDRHVVFIHGVRFSNANVWLSSDRNPKVWPRWLADDIPGLGVWSIEHDSAPTLWRGHAMPLASAANNDLTAWSNFVGDWLTELAFADMTREQAIALQGDFYTLLHVEPILWEHAVVPKQRFQRLSSHFTTTQKSPIARQNEARVDCASLP